MPPAAASSLVCWSLGAHPSGRLLSRFFKGLGHVLSTLGFDGSTGIYLVGDRTSHVVGVVVISICQEEEA